jgi:hypothetical protein
LAAPAVVTTLVLKRGGRLPARQPPVGRCDVLRQLVGVTAIGFLLALVLGVSGSAAGIPAVSFDSTGDLIAGWYWLRDAELSDRASWEFEGIPEGTGDLVLEITALATSGVSGGRGVDASFRIGYGFPGAGVMGGVYMVQEVVLPNVSPADDPVGYTCRSMVVIPRSTPGLATGRLTVFAERTSAEAPHVAFNSASVVIQPALVGAAVLRTATPASFASNGIEIEGSTWCRAEGEYLEWTWSALDADTARAHDMAVNLALLVTNEANGGSGYGASLQVSLALTSDSVVAEGTMDVWNPFSPQFAGDAHGVGYTAYGAVSLPDSLLPTLARGFSLRVLWPPQGTDYHVAGSPTSALLAWIEGDKE